MSSKIKPPFNLNKGALEIWYRLLEASKKVGLLDDCDHFLLARYCKLHGEVIDLYNWIEANPKEVEKTMISNKGQEYQVKHPNVTRLEKIEPQLLPMERALGFSPAIRRARKGGGTGELGKKRSTAYDRNA